jgi:hypothetical protein
VSEKVKLTGKQVAFVTKITCIPNAQEAAQKFLKIMKEEGLPSVDLLQVIDRCMSAWEKKYE